MAAFAHALGCGAQLVRAVAEGSAPWRPPPCVAALRRATAGGAAGLPRAHRARFLLYTPSFSAADRVRGLAPPGAWRAPRAFKDVLKVLTSRGGTAGSGDSEYGRV
jgi:hypothetical protein